MTRWERFSAFKEKHHLVFEVAFFFAGFLFDVVLLHRIDSVPLLIHQGVYLLASGLLVFFDHRLHVAGREPAGWLGKLASIRLWVMHFFLGTLLNAFLIFYFRAAAGWWAMVFIVLLAAVIVLNELPRFRQRGPVVRVALLSFCTTSYLAYLLPVVWGGLRSWQYYVAVVVGASVTVALWKLFVRFTHDPNWTFDRAAAPGLVVQVTLLVLYLLQGVPPVPLSLKSIVAAHDVRVVKDGESRSYAISVEPAPRWKLWAPASSTLHLIEGARAWVFVRIFAPARFDDMVQFAWEFDDPQRGWVAWGAPFSTRLGGGAETGYRTFANTTAKRPGLYRVRVLTADGREIGRETIEVVHVETAASTIVTAG
jgi:hypothetical protein